MKPLHTILFGIAVIGLAYMILNAGPSELGQNINKGIAYQRAYNTCVTEIERQVDQDSKAAREEVCLFVDHELGRDCYPSEDQILKWLKIKADLCAKKKIQN